MIRNLKIATWVFIVLAGVFFWIGLRNKEDNLEYTLYSLGLIAAAWMTNFFLKRYEKKKED